ncbi:YdeI/OmpD-associated family protein [Candidatus Saccharibacteria bacterium]|nr:YdeI/OmpD-associated family protein [Candidatus Saccharibacteria bacterium]HPR08941.1 YdeI/OmpD-associated family protein [Candidatus Saccharibacteria bacterium]
MRTPKLPGGTIHKLPDDFAAAIAGDARALSLWQDITPLARNEWVCWVTSGKLAETRTKRIRVGLDKMRKGERRPCCWIGCIHRTDKEISPSVKGILEKRAKK